jgi:Helix-turn-helix domain
VAQPQRAVDIVNGVVTRDGHQTFDDTNVGLPAYATSRRRDRKRAAELFVIDEWGSDSGFIEKAWQSHSVPEPEFISIATSHWHMVVTTQNDRRRLTLRGPETRATVTAIPADTEFFGIVFKLGTFTPAMPLARLVDRALELPAATRNSVWLDGCRWEIPTPDNADVFVDRLVRQGIVVRDAVVADACRSDVDGVSTRTLQRRVARATGLTRRTIRQIARAEAAVEALGKGVKPADVVFSLSYADQAHLIRSVKRFMGQTPAQVQGAYWSISSALERHPPGDH